MNNFEIQTLLGRDAQKHIRDLARLRMEVFKEYPYLYEGSLKEESKYLESFLENESNLLILATYNGEVIGASTAYPLSGADLKIQEALSAFDQKVERFFYFGESVLKKEFRGHGIGQRFFDERQCWASQNPEVQYLAFCAVERDADDPKKPIDYRTPYFLWKRNGFRKHEEVYTYFEWPELGQNTNSSHKMTFWIKELM